MMPEMIVIAPGSRVRLIINQGGMGPDRTLHDVSNPMHIVNDDGSMGAMNLKPQFLFFQWFLNEAMMRAFWQDVIAEAIEEERESCRLIAASEAEMLRKRLEFEGKSDLLRMNQTLGAGREATLIEALIRCRSDVKP